MPVDLNDLSWLMGPHEAVRYASARQILVQPEDDGIAASRKYIRMLRGRSAREEAAGDSSPSGANHRQGSGPAHHTSERGSSQAKPNPSLTSNGRGTFWPNNIRDEDEMPHLRAQMTEVVV